MARVPPYCTGLDTTPNPNSDSTALLQAMDRTPTAASWGTLRIWDATGETPREIPLFGKYVVVGRDEKAHPATPPRLAFAHLMRGSTGVPYSGGHRYPRHVHVHLEDPLCSRSHQAGHRPSLHHAARHVSSQPLLAHTPLISDAHILPLALQLEERYLREQPAG